MYHTNRPFNRASNSAAASRSRRLIRATAEALEMRLLLSTFVVNTFVDQTDAPGSKTVTVSLRDAIAAAAAHAGPDTIDVLAGNYPLTKGTLLIDDTTGTVTIDVSGGAAVINAQGNTGVLQVASGSSVSIDSLTITGGGFVSSAGGGGIDNLGQMTLVDCTVSGNTGAVSDGIYNSGRMTVMDSTISGNTGGGTGGIFNTGTLQLTNCTVSGNAAAYVGAIYNSGTAAVANSTITANDQNYEFQQSDNPGGGVSNAPAGMLTLANSIVAGNTSSVGPVDIGGTIRSLGNNLIGDASESSGWISTDLTGTDSSPLGPDLAPLGNYGGPTQTQVPLPGSPALGAGSAALIPAGVTTGQRGFARVVDGKVDIGAVESQHASVVTVTPPVVQSVVAGVAASIKLGSFTDPGGKGPFGVDVDWGDGSPDSYYPVSTIGSLGAQSHAFINIGTLKGTIIAVDGSGDVSKPVTFAISSAVAPAQTFTVNTTAAQTDPVGNKTVSLTDAVNRADASFGPVTINFDPNVFSAAQTISTGIQLSGDPAPITLDGPAAGVTINGGIDVNAGITVSLNRINATVSNSGTLAVSGSVISGDYGLYGGIYNTGTMTLTDSVVSGNKSEGGSVTPYLGGNGGGIDNTGTMTVSDSTITGNTAFAYVGYGLGGGIDNSGQMTLLDSTVFGNTAGYGGGVFNSGKMTVVGSTISGNSAPNRGGGGVGNSGRMTIADSTITANNFVNGYGGGISNGGTLSLANTIVAGNSNSLGDKGGDDVYGKVTSLGHNLIAEVDSASSGWLPTDLTGTDSAPLNPELSPLGFYGGPTQTQVPLPGSPAIGAGSVALNPAGDTTDQRGFARVVNGKVDIGAVEVHNASVVTVTPPTAQSVVAGVPADIKLGSFTDPGGKGPFTVGVDWGDGSAESSYSVSAVGALGSVSHVFTDTGALKVTIVVTDASGDVSKAASFAVSSAVAPAQTFTVNTTQDQTDPAGSKTVSLLDAVNLADASFGPVTITFDPKVFATAQTITFAQYSALDFSSNRFGPITLAGPAAGVTVSGATVVIDAGITASFSRLTITDADVEGGIDNSGHLSVTDSTITGNSDGIENSGQMTVLDCTITGNTGGLYGGIDNSGQMTVLDCTITGNTGASSTDGISNSGTLTLGNSIVAGNVGAFPGASDVSGAFDSLGYNLIGQIDSKSSGWISTDLTGTDADPLDPDLSPLGYFGGPTQTQVPLSGSPAIGAGSVALIPAGDTTDQRGFARVVGGKIDIGAVELQDISVVTVTPPATQSVVAGIPASINLGSFTDPAGKGPFTVIVNWGDGSADSTYTLKAVGPLGSQTHTFIEAGALKATIVVADSSGDVSKLASFSISSTGASITGTVFNDANGDGTQDNGEAGLAGVVVYADLGNVGYFVAGDPIATTNASGGYSLSGLLPGTYVIRQLSSSGYTQTFPTKGSAGHVTVSAGQTLSGQNFGDELPAATTGVITGTVFNDANGDGTQDHGETGLAGILVYADLRDVGHIVAGDPSTLTNATGGYVLSGLAAGSYVIRQVLPTGYVQTFPAKDDGHHVALSARQTLSGQDFGDKA